MASFITYRVKGTKHLEINLQLISRDEPAMDSRLSKFVKLSPITTSLCWSNDAYVLISFTAPPCKLGCGWPIDYLGNDRCTVF